MELLLLLTALFASLTGAGPGERADAARHVQQVVRSAQAAQAAVRPAPRAAPAAVAQPALRAERAAMPLLAAAPVSGLRAAPERRLE